MSLDNIRKEYELVDLFCNLAEIPSPSLKEKNVSDWILGYCKKNNIPAIYIFPQRIAQNNRLCFLLTWMLSGIIHL